MASPPNPLDKYSTYTYHFELHAHTSWDALANLQNSITAQATNRFEPNGTLLINTRTDAHQVIEDLKIHSLTPSVSRSEIATGTLGVEMTVFEPAGFAFTEKLNTLMRQMSVTNFYSLIFALKIYFVGRKPDNTVETLQVGVLPLVLANMEGTFTEAGGKYMLHFITANSLAAIGSPMGSGPQMQFAFIDRNVSIDARTLEDALKQLEDKLNDNYQYMFQQYQQHQSGATRPLKYKIELDSEVRGELTSVNKTTLAPDSPCHFTFLRSKQIAAAIWELVYSTPSLMKRIGEAAEATKQQLMPNAFFPRLATKVYYKDDSVEVTFFVGIYKGDSPGDPNAFFDFDFYFSDPGKNVDVMNYEVKFSNIPAWLSTRTQQGADKNFNFSGTSGTNDATNHAETVVVPNKTIPNLRGVLPERSLVDAEGKDIAWYATQTMTDSRGYHTIPAKDVPAIRLGSDVMASLLGAVNPQATFEIRGHLTILEACIPNIGSKEYKALSDGQQGMWVKVNVYMPDSRSSTGKRQFYYNGYYHLVSVINHFSGGRFTQQLTVIAMDEYGADKRSLKQTATFVERPTRGVQ